MVKEDTLSIVVIRQHESSPFGLLNRESIVATTLTGFGRDPAISRSSTGTSFTDSYSSAGNALLTIQQTEIKDILGKDEPRDGHSDAFIAGELPEMHLDLNFECAQDGHTGVTT
ncbi:hypothetical protein ACJX0J_026447 [Zea mays]